MVSRHHHCAPTQSRRADRRRSRRPKRIRVLRIRLRRAGARKKPQYRLVVAESTSPRDGRYIEIIGTYNPLTNPSTVNIKTERAQHWLSVGATTSDRVHKILANEGLMEQPKFVTEAKAAAETAGAA